MMSESMNKTVLDLQKKLQAGGEAKYHEKNAEAGKLFARKRIELLCDPSSFVEDGLFANCVASGLPADGVVTGLGTVGGRRVAVMANDSTVKAGSWGARTVEKILRLQETAERLRIPVFYLVDSAGARITDQVEMFPGRRGAGRIFYNEANFSGVLPQICILFGPSAAGGAYIPAFCDIVIMVRGNASMYLGSPRMAESVIGEKVSLEEMGGAALHCTESGVGDLIAESETEAIEIARTYFGYMPQSESEPLPVAPARNPKRPASELEKLVPTSPTRAYNMKDVIEALVDEGSIFEIKPLYAKELITAFARIEGRPVGIVANQPMVKGGVLFVNSSDKAARFIQSCGAWGIPIVFLSDVPGFMIGSKIEREGMIRAGAKMIYSLSRVGVPKISVIVRKAFGAGLYAMAGPAYGSDCVLALPSAQIAVMGPEPAINAVYYNKLETMAPAEKAAFIAEKSVEYEREINIVKLASELVIDALIPFERFREEIAARLRLGVRPKAGPRPPGIMPM